jgi:hypothetical protein
MVHDRRSGCGSSPPICSVDQRDDAIDARSKFERVSSSVSGRFEPGPRHSASTLRKSPRPLSASYVGRDSTSFGQAERHRLDALRPVALEDHAADVDAGRAWETVARAEGARGRGPAARAHLHCWCWLSLPLRAKATFGDVSRALDVEPSPELRRLHAHILERESALQVPVPTRPRQAPTFRRRTERPRWNAPGSLAAGEHQWRNGHGRHPVVLEIRGGTQVAAKYCREPGAAVAATVPLTPFSPRFGELQSGWLPVGNWQWRTYRRG